MGLTASRSVTTCHIWKLHKFSMTSDDPQQADNVPFWPDTIQFDDSYIWNKSEQPTTEFEGRVKKHQI